MLPSVAFLFGSGKLLMRRNVLAGGRRKAAKIGKDKFSAGQTFCWYILDPAVTYTQRHVCEAIRVRLKEIHNSEQVHFYTYGRLQEMLGIPY